MTDETTKLSAALERLDTHLQDVWGDWSGDPRDAFKAMGKALDEAKVEANRLEAEVKELRAKQVAIDSNGHYCDGMSDAWSAAQAAISEVERLREYKALAEIGELAIKVKHIEDEFWDHGNADDWRNTYQPALKELHAAIDALSASEPATAGKE